MAETDNLFYKNEQQANRYVSFCLLAATGVAAVTWILNLVGFFVVDETVMNISMPVTILLMIVPSVLLLADKIHGRALPYILVGALLLGLSILSVALTKHLVLAWACPIILSCHYYSPKLTRMTLISSLILLLVTIYLGMFFGEWDAHLLQMVSPADKSLAARQEIIENLAAQGKNLIKNTFNFYYLPRAGILCLIYIISVTLSRRTHRLLEQQQKDLAERERISAELNVAHEIQASALPNLFPAFPDRPEFDIYATMTPSKEVGGDFYDFFIMDEDHLALVIADVSGKGVPAAMYMMVAKTLIKNNTIPGRTPAQILEIVNNQLCETESTEMFVTVWLGIYEISTGKIIAANAGHEYPMICHEGRYEMLKDRHGFVLGGIEDSRYRDYTIDLDIGDSLLVYTDGVVEANDPEGRQYGMERLIETINRPAGSLKEFLEAIRGDVNAHANGADQFDDITLLTIMRKM